MKKLFTITIHVFLLLLYSTAAAQTPNTTLLGNYNTDGIALDVVINNNRAYVADNDRGLKIIDVLTPSNPQELGNYLPPLQSLALSVAIQNNYAFVVTDNAGLRIVNISNPTAYMPETGGLNLPGNSNGVAVSG